MSDGEPRVAPTVADIHAIECPECGAGPNEPCTDIPTTNLQAWEYQKAHHKHSSGIRLSDGTRVHKPRWERIFG